MTLLIKKTFVGLNKLFLRDLKKKSSGGNDTPGLVWAQQEPSDILARDSFLGSLPLSVQTVVFRILNVNKEHMCQGPTIMQTLLFVWGMRN